MTVEKMPGNDSPKYGEEPQDVFVGKKKVTPRPRSVIEKVVDVARRVIPEIGNFIQDKIGRSEPAAELPVSAPR